MNMVVRGLENYKVMDQMYMHQYPKQYRTTRKAIQYKYFNKLLSYLTRIDVNKFENKFKIGDSYEIMHNTYMLQNLMYYYEGLEQYEKCAKLKKIIDKIKD